MAGSRARPRVGRGADLEYLRELVDYWTVTGSWNGALRAMRSSPVTPYWVTNTIGSSFLPYVGTSPVATTRSQCRE